MLTRLQYHRIMVQGARRPDREDIFEDAARKMYVYIICSDVSNTHSSLSVPWALTENADWKF
jgi:hypothetical protein